MGNDVQGGDAQGGGAADKPPVNKDEKRGETREDRVAAALRANLRRRKTQARGRKSETDPRGRTS